MTLSHGGLAALIPTDLKVGDAVELYFSLPYPVAHVLAEAVVRGRDGYRYGFEFVRLNLPISARSTRPVIVCFPEEPL